MKKHEVILEIQKYFKNPIDDYKLINIELRNKLYYICVKCSNSQHDAYWVSWQHFKNRGDRCSKCRYINNGTKSLIYNADKIANIVDEHGYNLIRINSIGDEGKIIISSKEGYIINTRVNNIARGSMPEFFHVKNQYTINNIRLWCTMANKSYVLISSVYTNANKNLNWKCLKCDKEFEMSWNTISKSIFECPYCSGKRASKTNNLLINNWELAKQWDYEKNYPVRPENVLPNTIKKYWWICDNCNYNWIESVHNRNRKIPCPNCKMSKGEHTIKSFLEDNNIDYKYEYKFNNCKNIKSLRFDFYLPKYNLCIEYQGEFHYKILNGISNENILNKQKMCDNIKKDFCKKEDIDLLEIPYWEYKNINNILFEKLIQKM